MIAESWLSIYESTYLGKFQNCGREKWKNCPCQHNTDHITKRQTQDRATIPV
jgi:hypothetical protein